MALKIKKTETGSQAERLGLLPEESVLRINEHKINTFLDLQYYGADNEFELEVRKLSGKIERYYLENVWEDFLGIIPADHTCRECINHCVFCFIDQMPPQQRETLYIKDDDYCFSFVFGNFLTLTNLTENDYQKIFEQRLSPLYVSVHTTNPELHKKMLRYSRDFDIMKQLSRFSENGIDFHSQIVVVPGYNDGQELIRTLKDLSSFQESCISIGIVPVGLTKYREGLPELNTIDESKAKEIIELSAEFKRAYCSDEFYLKAGIEIPGEEFYDDFPQLENGIGMIRYMLINWASNKEEFLNWIQEMPGRLVFISGQLASDVIKGIAEEINESISGKAKVKVIRNEFMGETVTVTGLLTWHDIENQLELDIEDIPVFSSNTFNTEGVTLDGYSQAEIAEKLDREVIIVDEGFAGWEKTGD